VAVATLTATPNAAPNSPLAAAPTAPPRLAVGEPQASGRCSASGGLKCSEAPQLADRAAEGAPGLHGCMFPPGSSRRRIVHLAKWNRSSIGSTASCLPGELPEVTPPDQFPPTGLLHRVSRATSNRCSRRLQIDSAAMAPWVLPACRRSSTQSPSRSAALYEMGCWCRRRSEGSAIAGCSPISSTAAWLHSSHR
jgi:hypothetical protein